MPQRRNYPKTIQKTILNDLNLQYPAIISLHVVLRCLKEILGWQTSPMLNCFQFTAPADIEVFGRLRVTPWARIPKTRSAEPRASLQEDHSWRPNVRRGPYMGHGPWAMGHGAMGPWCIQGAIPSSKAPAAKAT